MRQFAVTRKGYFALVLRVARIRDKIVVFKKAYVPFIIRRTKFNRNVSIAY